MCAIVGVAVWVCLIPLQFRFSLLVAVICGLGYAVPFVGMIVAQVFALVLAAPQGGAMMISVTLVVFCIARFADSLLVPKVMSESVGVSPIGVMFAVFAGGELFGIPGLLFGIPAAALIKVLFKYFVQPYIARMQIGEVPHLAVDVKASGTAVEIDVAEPAPRGDADAAEPVVVRVRR